MFPNDCLGALAVGVGGVVLGTVWSFLYKGKCLNPHLPPSLDKYLASGVLRSGWGGLLPAQDALSRWVWVLCLFCLLSAHLVGGVGQALALSHDSH